MTEEPAAELAATMSARLGLAIRQACLIAIALVLSSAIAEGYRPSAAPDRSLASSSFLWAIVVWGVVLLVDVAAFDRSQLELIVGLPAKIGSVVAAATFVIGLISFGFGGITQRILYLLANAIGVFFFWWSVAALVALTMRWVTAHSRC